MIYKAETDERRKNRRSNVLLIGTCLIEEQTRRAGDAFILFNQVASTNPLFSLCLAFCLHFGHKLLSYCRLPPAHYGSKTNRRLEEEEKVCGRTVAQGCREKERHFHTVDNGDVTEGYSIIYPASVLH